ncbi:MAG: aminoacyl-tRNA hydrolase [Solirubrobacterales bacterium]|nr:aminoacyl-tRNA hydrolase [Solirubrobacterales bacterium]
MDDPLVIDGVVIPRHEIELRASRSSGPGGQHANTTATRVEASFDVAASRSLTDEQKRRVRSRAGARVTAVAQDERSQTRNRELALERLAARLAAALTVRRPRSVTRPPAAAGRRREEDKRRQSARKRDRRSPGLGDE